MKRAEVDTMRDLARAVVGSVIFNPQTAFPALKKVLTIEALPISERQLFQAVQKVFESNGRKEGQINPGDVLAVHPELDTALYTDCIDLASTTRSAIESARELTRLHKEGEIKGTRPL